MKLVEPHIQYQAEYLGMLAEWQETGEDLVPFTLQYETEDFAALVKKLHSFKTEVDRGWVCHSSYWLINEEGQLVATSNLRHELNENLLEHGGHIGYGVRPSFRNKGYATKILELTLQVAKKMGIEKALLTCDTDNIASAKTITKNGGVLWRERDWEGVPSQCYWIEIK